MCRKFLGTTAPEFGKMEVWGKGEMNDFDLYPELARVSWSNANWHERVLLPPCHTTFVQLIK